MQEICGNLCCNFADSELTIWGESYRFNQILPPARVRKAIATGMFEGGGQNYPCGVDVEEAASLFLKRFVDTYQRLVGGALA